MADDRLACLRPPSIAPTNAVTVTPRSSAISLKLFQNSSSRLILVLWPSMLIERFKTRDTASPTTNEPAITILTAWRCRQEKALELVPPGDTEVSPSAVWASGFQTSRSYAALALIGRADKAMTVTRLETDRCSICGMLIVGP